MKGAVSIALFILAASLLAACEPSRPSPLAFEGRIPLEGDLVYSSGL